jgi:hypothetical protein
LPGEVVLVGALGIGELLPVGDGLDPVPPREALGLLDEERLVAGHGLGSAVMTGAGQALHVGGLDLTGGPGRGGDGQGLHGAAEFEDRSRGLLGSAGAVGQIRAGVARPAGAPQATLVVGADSAGFERFELGPKAGAAVDRVEDLAIAQVVVGSRQLLIELRLHRHEHVFDSTIWV